MSLHNIYIVPAHHRRRASKGPSNQQDADCDDLDDEEQFLSLDDVLEGHPELPTCFACALCWHLEGFGTTQGLCNSSKQGN